MAINIPSTAILLPTTEFKYDGKIFQLCVSIGTADDILLPVKFDDRKKYLLLANENIECLEILNTINKLYMTGSLIYTDVDGYMTDFLNRTNIEVIVDFRRILTKADGDVSIKNEDPENKIYHIFLVNNIEILERSGNMIKYKLYLISKNLNGLIKTLHYSNYGKEPEKITDILKTLFKRAAADFGPEPLFTLGKAFEEDETMSDVAINYTTNGNDNLLSITKFLLSRMFYYQLKTLQRDTSLKFIYYDLFDNKYSMIDLAKMDLTKASNDKIILSMFKTAEELMTYSSQLQLATVISFPQSKYKKLVFGTHTYDYDQTQNKILHEYITLKTLTKYHDNNDSKNSTGIEPLTTPKDDVKNPNYANQYVYWTNLFDIYQTMVDSLLKFNSLVIHTGPNMRRCPGNLICIAIPPDKSNITSENSKAYETVNGRYNLMQGGWIIGSVRNLIYPSSGLYRQNLVLFKNFLTKNEAAT